MVTMPNSAELLHKIEAILTRLDGNKSALQADMADCLIALRFLLKHSKQEEVRSTIELPKPKRNRAVYMRDYRLRVKAGRPERHK